MRLLIGSGEGRANPYANRLNAEAIVIIARQTLTKTFAHAIHAIGAHRHFGIDVVCGFVIANHVIRASENHALHVFRCTAS